MGNTKARKAKAETLARWEGVRAKLLDAHEIISEDCAFCEVFDCPDCLACYVCGHTPHSDAVGAVYIACEDVQTLIDEIRGIKV